MSKLLVAIKHIVRGMRNRHEEDEKRMSRQFRNNDKDVTYKMIN